MISYVFCFAKFIKQGTKLCTGRGHRQHNINNNGIFWETAEGGIRNIWVGWVLGGTRNKVKQVQKKALFYFK
jgi:hypothetical protein